MYAPERVQWWLERSKSPEYQSAYGVIAKHVRRERPEVVLDIGCGPGEMMMRLYEGTRLLVGTDATPEMLDIAYENLRSAGVSPRMGKDASGISPEDTGVVLVKDNVIQSEMPDGFFDAVLLAFPEIGDEYDESPLDASLIASFEKKYRRLKRDEIRPALAVLRAFYHISRGIRMRGIMVNARYDESGGRQDDTMCLSRHYEEMECPFGMKTESARFYESPKIWSDVTDEEETGNSKKGYRIIKMRKT